MDSNSKEFTDNQYIEIIGAREHNLKNIDLKIPRNQLITFTGISGSGKSSLAFDTIYAEGQRRYMESFSAYARSFIGNMERPDVDKINGLSPVISIEQKTTSKNPRSTVGTVTEIYDFLRLLFARAGVAYSYLSGKKMIKQTIEQIIEQVITKFENQYVVLLAPIVKARKGHYRELFTQIIKMGFTKVRIDGEIKDLEPKMQLDRYKTHDIEIVVDRILIEKAKITRLTNSIETTMKHGDGVIMIIDENNEFTYFSKFLMDPETGLSYSEPAPNNFSFNSPYGACNQCNGLGIIEKISLENLIVDENLNLAKGLKLPINIENSTHKHLSDYIDDTLKKHKIKYSTLIKDIPKKVLEIIAYGEKDFQNNGVFPIIPYLEHLKFNSPYDKERDNIASISLKEICDGCKGGRLNPVALNFKIDDKNIAELATMNIRELISWFANIEERLSERQNIIAKEVLKEINKRLGFLIDVGLDYLNLNRPVKSLSGGESQRIRLASQIGTQLVNVLYILDEPSIGLHQRDNVKLIQALKDLRDLGNTVIVVEHDKDMMLASDFIVDIGPGAGIHGGKIVDASTPQNFLKNNTVTAKYLSNIEKIEVPKKRREGNGNFLTLKGAKGNNLKNIDIKLPLGKMICFTGVSGSGKSSLIHETLYPILRKKFYNSSDIPLEYESIEGIEFIDKVIEVDQSPIGRTPRSNPATYTGVFTDIRDLFANLTESKIRGYKSGRFSFNVKGGRCETCQGGGKRVIEMDFLPSIHVLCETCKGKRYNRETLEVRFKGKSISDILEMTVEQAVEFFENQPKILNKIVTLNEVGLGYISLGQHATTISGGEAQRVKLATEFSKKDTGKTFYILDEPSTGLHFQDIKMLLQVLNKLANKGNTVLIIEHNLDIIKISDYIIDLGPEGGTAGGQIIAEGTPEEIVKLNKGYTAQFLKQELNY